MIGIFRNSFFDGFTYDGLFTKLERPGSATQVFPDPTRRWLRNYPQIRSTFRQSTLGRRDCVESLICQDL